jgi:hypothetical protein
MWSYVFHINDDMQSIMMIEISDNSFIAKWRGGFTES